MTTSTYDGSRTMAKGKVNCVSTANIASLNDTQTVGGLACTDGDLALLTAQTTGTENGLYTVRADADWERHVTFGTADACANGALFFCAEGTYAGTYWRLGTAAVTPGTTDHTITMVEDSLVFGAAADMVANTTTKVQFGPVNQAVTVVDITSDARTAASSAAGAVTYTILSAGNALTAATVDLEADGATRTSQTLHGTAANLDLVAGDVFTWSIISDNADATGGLDCSIKITCIPTAP